MVTRKKVLGQLVKQHRKEQRLTQEELARESRISVGRIGRIERGEGQLAVEELRPLASALGVTRDEFLDLLEYEMDAPRRDRGAAVVPSSLSLIRDRADAVLDRGSARPARLLVQSPGGYSLLQISVVAWYSEFESIEREDL